MGIPRKEEDLPQRTTEEVLEDHLRCRTEDDIEGDLKWNYAEEVIILTSRGAYHGHDGIRELYGHLQKAISGSNYEFPLKLTDGPYAFIEWRARKPGKSVEDGADSFVIKNGKIICQTIHYMVEETMPLGET